MVCGLLGHGLLTLGARSVLSRQTMPIHNGLQNLESAIKWARSAHRNQTMSKNTTDLDLFHPRLSALPDVQEHDGVRRRKQHFFGGRGQPPGGVSTPGHGQGEGPDGYKFPRSGDAGDVGRGRSEAKRNGVLREVVPFPLPQTKGQFLSLGFLPHHQNDGGLLKTTVVH